MPRRLPDRRSLSWDGRPRLNPRDAEAVTEQAEAQLLKQVDELKSIRGHGQEQGAEADGTDVNVRREALSVLLSRMSVKELTAKLPKRGQKLLANLQRDLQWLESAERQTIATGKPFDFSWSKNPMSTPTVLDALATRRAAAASAAAQAIQSEPNTAYDASNDSLLCHLQLDSPSLRSQVLADTLIQFRAQRRSEGLMDADLAPASDVEGQSTGRMASSGTVSAYEQRLALKNLPTGRSFEAQREAALLRLIVGAATIGSVNNIYAGRNAVGALPAFMGFGVSYDAIGDEPGLQANFHDAIHKSYSANTANAVEHYVKQRVFKGGDAEDRPEILRLIVNAASADDIDGARSVLAELKKSTGYEVPKAETCTKAKQLRSVLIKHLAKQTDIRDLATAHPIGLLKSMRLILSAYKAVVLDRPSIDELQSKLFYAASATPEVAQLIHAMRTADQPAQLEAVGRARLALSKAFQATDSAFERQMIARLDRRVELLATEIIGTSVDTVLNSDADTVGEALLATHSALRNVVASGLHTLRARPKTAPVEDLPQLLKEVEKLLAQGGASLEEVQKLMTKVFASSQEVTDAMGGFFKRRESAIHFGKLDLELDPDFTGNLVKETPLHHLLSLSNHLRTLGTKTEISADEVRFVGGMRVLNSTGPRVYKRILVAKTTEALARYRPTVDDLCVVQSADEKNLVYGGGLVLDTKDAGPGLAHAVVFAKGHGINAIALPNLKSAIDTFFRKASKDAPQQGFYVDPRAESFVIKPVSSAIEERLMTVDDIDSLRPGFNLDVDYFDINAAAKRVLVDEHSLHLSDDHDTRNIELIVPDLGDKLDLKTPQSFKALEELHIDQVRQLAGEKGAVLVDLSKSERLKALGVTIPPGGVVPPFEVAELLREAKVGSQSLLDLWTATPERSEFQDEAKRPALLAKTKRTTAKSLQQLLLDGDRATPLGKELLETFEQHFDLDPNGDWIFRSSFTAEDRPYKSGAGQYDSVVVPAKPARTRDRRRLEALAQVISSTWNTSAVQSNTQSGLSLEHVWPSVVVQKALNPSVSGVGVSRGATGGFGQVSYQATPKFGGAVEGGSCEEGVLSSNDSQISRGYNSKETSLLKPKQQALLRSAILAIEEDFNDRIEPGQGFAVDVEWAFVGDELHILQARTIVGV